MKLQMKLESVQYLRGLAALVVVAYHAAGHLGAIRPDFSFLRYGEFGVDLFFVISGFIMIVTTSPATSPGYFLGRRLVRIIPLYWLITFVYFAVVLIAPNLVRSANSDLSHIILSLLFIPHYNPVFPANIWPLVIPGWSLNYEMFFYAILTLALLLSAKYRGPLTIGILVLLILAGQILALHNPIFLTYTNPLLLEFIMGMSIGMVFLLSKPVWSAAGFFLFLLIIIAAYICSMSGLPVWRSLIWGPVGGCLLTGALYMEQRGFRFSSALAIGLGDASYSIYLTHPAAIAITRMIANVFAIPNNNITKLGGLAVALIVASLVGWLTYVIERPVLVSLRSLFGHRTADLAIVTLPNLSGLPKK